MRRDLDEPADLEDNRSRDAADELARAGRDHDPPHVDLMESRQPLP
jgi:hypothetical protein